MKVVVTGGGGYVGYHVGWAIYQGGHHVVLLDLVQPDPEWSDMADTTLKDALPEGFWGRDVKPGQLEHVTCDITDLSALQRHLADATAVIHTASYGVSGRLQLRPHIHTMERVNVGGTRAVLAAATRAGVRALVYTSTYNVVFGGEEIRGGDESSPLYPLHLHTDHYSRTKAMAEMLVLTANGKSVATPGLDQITPGLDHTSPSRDQITPGLDHTSPGLDHTSPSLDQITPGPDQITPGPDHASPGPDHASPGLDHNTPSVVHTSPSRDHPTLRTCSLRLAGVMGLGERRHTRRIVGALRSGMVVFTFGKRDALVDFIGIQNTVQAHVKAMMALLNEQDRPVCYGALDSSPGALPAGPSDPLVVGASSGASGHAFFVSDDAPMNHWQYLRPFFDGFGLRFPSISLPLWTILILAHLQEFLYCLVYRVMPFTPFVTPAETYKSGMCHYFSCKKAKDLLGYSPTRPNDLSLAVPYEVMMRSKDEVGEGATRTSTWLVLAMCIPVVIALLLWLIP